MLVDRAKIRIISGKGGNGADEGAPEGSLDQLEYADHHAGAHDLHCQESEMRDLLSE